MKSYLFPQTAVLALLIAAAGSGLGQNADPAASRNAPAQAAAPKSGNSGGGLQPQSGIIKRDGVVYFMKDGAAQRVVQDMQLAEGIHVSPRGDVKLPDGKQLKLSEGQMVTMQGQVTNAPAGF